MGRSLGKRLAKVTLDSTKIRKLAPPKLEGSLAWESEMSSVINVPEGGICIVGTDICGLEWKPGPKILQACLTERNWEPSDFNYLSMSKNTVSELKALKPRLVMALGNWASKTLAKGCYDSMQQRGYIFEAKNLDCPVLVSVDPGDVQKQWVPWRVLLSLDFAKLRAVAGGNCVRPTRTVSLI